MFRVCCIQRIDGSVVAGPGNIVSVSGFTCQYIEYGLTYSFREISWTTRGSYWYRGWLLVLAEHPSTGRAKRESKKRIKLKRIRTSGGAAWWSSTTRQQEDEKKMEKRKNGGRCLFVWHPDGQSDWLVRLPNHRQQHYTGWWGWEGVSGGRDAIDGWNKLAISNTFQFLYSHHIVGKLWSRRYFVMAKATRHGLPWEFLFVVLHQWLVRWHGMLCQ